MTLTGITAFDLARRFHYHPEGQSAFYLLVAPDRGTVEAISEELGFQSDRGVLNLVASGPSDLLNQASTTGDSILLVSGLEDWKPQDFADLDIARGRLELGKVLVFIADCATAAKLLVSPNLSGYLGSNAFELLPDPSYMSESEVAERLNDLRSHFGRTDAQVVELARKGQLEPDPEFAEWLVLMGRGDLV